MRNDLSNRCDRILYKKDNGESVTKPKKKYKTDEDAILTCKKINSQRKQIHKVVAYRCKECDGYHIGKTKKVLSKSDKQKYKRDLKYSN